MNNLTPTEVNRLLAQISNVHVDYSRDEAKRAAKLIRKRERKERFTRVVDSITVLFCILMLGYFIIARLSILEGN